MGRGSCGISDAERKKLQALAEQNNQEAIVLLAKKNREAVSTKKFVYLSVETDPVYNGHSVTQIDSHYINYTSNVARLQSPQTRRQDLEQANQERVSQGFASMPVDSDMDYESVMYQFLGDDRADLLQIMEPNTMVFRALDAVVDEILPRVKHEKFLVELGSFYTGRRADTQTQDVEKEVTVGAERQPPVELSSLPMGRGQNCNVAMGFLSLEAMQNYVTTSAKLGLVSTPQYEVTQANLVQFERCSITKLTVEHVLVMMPPAMSMHMLPSEIQQAQDNGKMYVVTAGMLQSQLGEGSKTIFSMRMLRQANAGFEVPTYNSHSVEVSSSSKRQHCMHMAENSVNLLVHFKKNKPTDHANSIELWGRDSVHRQQTKLVGHYEKVESEQWPAGVIQDIVNGTTPCLQGNVLSPYNMTGTTSVVLTPAKHYTASSNLHYILLFSGIENGCSGPQKDAPAAEAETGGLAMWVKVMTSDINAKSLCNDNISAMTVPKKANTPTRTTCGDDLEVITTEDAISEDTLYPNQAALTSYGLGPQVQVAGWNIAAAGIMFSGQFAVYVTTHARDNTHGPDIDKDDEDAMHEYYAHTRVPMQNACMTSEYADDPNAVIKCLTYEVNEDSGVTIHVCQLKSALSFHDTNTHFQSIFFAEGAPSEPADLEDPVVELQRKPQRVDRENSAGGMKNIIVRPQAHIKCYDLDPGENMYSIILAVPETENKKMHRAVCLKFVNAQGRTPI